jgi:hypothetical protein
MTLPCISKDPIPPQDPASPNRWIGPLREEWLGTPLKFLPRAAQGLQLLDRLLAFQNEIPQYECYVPFQSIYHRQVPTMAHIMADLDLVPINELTIYDQGLRHGAYGITKPQLMASWFRAPYIREFNPTYRLYNILDLPCHKDGLGQCEITVPPGLLEQGMEERIDGVSIRGSAICPAGTLTDIHKDYSGSGQFMISVEGRKLWLIWPPTEKNLKWWTAHHTRTATATLTLDAINNMEGLELLLHEGQESFLILPYYFHAVLTFEASAHCGSPIWRLDWWQEIAKAAMEWEYLWAKDHAANGFSAKEVDAVLKEMQDAQVHWGALAAKFTAGRISKDLKTWHKHMSKKIKDLRKQIEQATEAE